MNLCDDWSYHRPFIPHSFLICSSPNSKPYNISFLHITTTQSSLTSLQRCIDRNKERKPTHQIHRMCTRYNRHFHSLWQLYIMSWQKYDLRVEIPNKSMDQTIWCHFKCQFLFLSHLDHIYCWPSEISIKNIRMMECKYRQWITQHGGIMDIDYICGFQRKRS